jgi:CubicO group peptidase (beta-lactamase class C family)
MEMVPAARRREAVALAQRPTDWSFGGHAAYSEFAGWHVLGWLLESVTGEPLREHLRRTVLDPLELDSTWIGMTPDEYRVTMPRFGVNVDMRNLGGFPLLFERTERVCTETNPAHGGYTNARDLARLYSALLATLDERGQVAPVSASTLRRFCSPARPRMYDMVLGRECSYGLGFMTDLRDHSFGERCDEASFGHSGNVGASFAFADPAHDLAVGVVFNGVVGHEAAFLRRQALVNAIYADLDELTERREPAYAGTGQQSKSRFRLGRRA